MVSFALAVLGREAVVDAASGPFFKAGVDFDLFSEDDAERTGLEGLAPVFDVFATDCEGPADAAFGALEPPVPGRVAFDTGSGLLGAAVDGAGAFEGSSLDSAVAVSGAGSSIGVTFAANGSSPLSSLRSTAGTVSDSATVVVSTGAGSGAKTVG